MKNLAGLSAVKLVRAIKKKQISSVELLEFYIERYKRWNPKINAIVATDFDNARKRARAADNALAKGDNWGTLHGLAMTIKDNIEVIGMPTTNGSPLFKDFMPPKNADVVQSLLDAGAIIFGKTNLPLFAMDTQTYNKVYGQTNNPWDFKRTPGGSSGGACAALAAGLTGLEIGNDIGGSIRLPAHFCGVYGHKSTYGIVSMHCDIKAWSMMDNKYSVPFDLAVNGPLARSAEDLRLAMNVIVGPPSYEKKAIIIKLPRPRKTKLNDFKIGLWIDDKIYPTDNEVGNCMQNMIEQLKKTKARIKVKKPDVDLQRCYRLRDELGAMTLSHTESQATIKKAWRQSQTLKKDDQSPEAIHIRSIKASHLDWNLLNLERAVIRKKWDEYFQEFDVLLCPVVRIAAHEHNHRPFFRRVLRFNDHYLSYWDILAPWNSLSLVAYLPATVAPIGFTSDGLPVGVQIIGPYLEDLTTIEFARLLEKEGISSFKLPPGFE